MKGYRISSIDVNGISEETLRSHFAVMDEKKKAEILSLPSDVKKKQKIAADMLCRRMISEKCGNAPGRK